MASSIIERNIKSLKSNLKANLSYVDIDYKGFTDGQASVLYDGKAIVNQYKMWLQSKPYDYIRNPDRGGFCFINLKKYRFDPSSEKAIAKELTTLTQQNFANIQVVDIKVTCEEALRAWRIQVRIIDTITHLLGDLGREGVLMYL